MTLPRWSVLIAFAVIGAATSGSVAGEPAQKPNVLFILIDDLRPELGCYGQSLIKTPHIDGLAKAGVRFERAYVQFPLCNPSRSSMLTSRYPTQTGVLDNRTWFGALQPDFVSLPRYFLAQGYLTIRIGKVFHGGIDDSEAWSMGGEKRPFEGPTSPKKPAPNAAQNSDRIIRLEGNGEQHADHKSADKAIELLRQKRDRPFFMALGFTRPHSPPTAPKKFFDMYDPAKIPLPGDFASRPAAPAGFPRASIPAKNSDLFIDREAVPDEARQMIQAYWASVSWVDWNIGRVIDELDKLGLRENTIIVVWGDHGYHLGEKGKWSKHGSLFEIGTRVPLIVIAPAARGNGQTCPRVVQSLDIYPTLTALCKLPEPKGLEGRSLVPLLADPKTKWDHPAFSVIGVNNKLAGVAVRTERYRYAEYGDGNDAMLFDHAGDPHETRNLAADPKLAEVRTELAERLRRFRAEKTRTAKQDKAKTRVLFIGKNPDHPFGTHMYMHTCEMLAKCIELTPGVETVVSNGWPKDAQALDGVKTIVIYTSPAAEFLLEGPQRGQVDELMKKGVGLVTIHWASSVNKANLERLGPTWLSYLGGTWVSNVGLSGGKSPLKQLLPDHPICRGWKEYDLDDEYYLDPVIKQARPLLQVRERKGKDVIVGWVYERPDGGRAFATTLGHPYKNFQIEPFRRMIVNGILWSAHVDVPQAGAPVNLSEEALALPPKK